MLSKQPVEKNLLRQNEDSMILEMLTALVLIGFSSFFHPCNFYAHPYCAWQFIDGSSIKSSRWVNMAMFGLHVLRPRSGAKCVSAFFFFLAYGRLFQPWPCICVLFTDTQISFLSIFSLKMGFTILFTYLKIILQ